MLQPEPNVSKEEVWFHLNRLDENHGLDLSDKAKYVIDNRASYLDYLHGKEWFVSSPGTEIESEDYFNFWVKNNSRAIFPSINFNGENHLKVKDGYIINHKGGKIRAGKAVEKVITIVKRKTFDWSDNPEEAREEEISRIRNIYKKYQDRRRKEAIFRYKVFTDPISILSCSTNRAWKSCLSLNKGNHSSPRQIYSLLFYILSGAVVIYSYYNNNKKPSSRDLFIAGNEGEKPVLLLSMNKFLGIIPNNKDYRFSGNNKIEYVKKNLGVTGINSGRQIIDLSHYYPFDIETRPRKEFNIKTSIKISTADFEIFLRAWNLKEDTFNLEETGE